MKRLVKVFLIIFFVTNVVFTQEKISSYPLPNTNEYTQYIYVSKNYEYFLSETKSHPIAVSKLNAPKSPILFYQEYYNKYSACSNLHEGGPMVDIDKSKKIVTLFNDEYYKVKIDSTVENTLSKIILINIFSKRDYKGNEFQLSIRDKVILNGIECMVLIDIGGGYNSLKQTMIKTTQEINGYNLFAIIEDEGSLKITPLETDDIVAYSSGKTFILK